MSTRLAMTEVSENKVQLLEAKLKTLHAKNNMDLMQAQLQDLGKIIWQLCRRNDELARELARRNTYLHPNMGQGAVYYHPPHPINGMWVQPGNHIHAPRMNGVYACFPQPPF